MATDIVCDLLRVQKHKDENFNQRYGWADWLNFLQPTTRYSLDLVREQTSELSGQYVVLSYTWACTQEDDDTCGSFTIHNSPRGRNAQNRVRDSILRRVRRFAAHCDITRIWIDQECLDQDNKPQMDVARQCMDFVYSRSGYPVALLNNRLSRQIDIDLFGLLLRDEMTYTESLELPQLRQLMCRSMAAELLDLLLWLAEDPWWSRRWTLQEEYKCSGGMTLLIPHAANLRKARRFDGVRCEFKVSAKEFRTKATVFALSYQQSCTQQERTKCKAILRVLGSYKVLDEVEYGRRLALTPRLLRDLARRESDQEWDVPVILANTCGFRTRLNLDRLQASNETLATAIAALYFMNGELFNNVKKYALGTGTRMVMSRLVDMAPNLDHIPALEKTLTYVKHCRLPHPRLVGEGVLTKGLLWNLCETLDSRDIRMPDFDFVGRTPPYRLNRFQTRCLYGLVNRLSRLGREYRELCKRLKSYLKFDATSTEGTAAHRYMNTMAEEIVEAIRLEADLILARPLGTDDILGIFVNVPEGVFHAFTAWEPPSRDESLDWEVSQARHVSLAVHLEPGRMAPRIRNAGWMSGLVLTSGLEPDNVVYAWPPNWGQSDARNTQNRRTSGLCEALPTSSKSLF